jgi:2-polyprenyl-3-methyl-5-hydroxy-6-metoxy-1,4-benzoquinol methylase
MWRQSRVQVLERNVQPMTLETPSSIAGIARELYVSGPALTRSMQGWRPYICPFHKIVDEVPPGSFILDIGCGGGLLMGVLSRLGRITGGVGFDFSKLAIDVATAMSRSLGRNCGLSFELLSAVDPWPVGPFTLVTMIDVLHHIPVRLQHDIFCRAARAVKPGARLIVKDMAPRPRWRASANTLHDLLMARQWVHYVHMTTMVEWARAEDLTVTKTFQYNQLWYGHQFAVFDRAL